MDVKPGDLIVAKTRMRSWDSINEKGLTSNGAPESFIKPRDFVLVLYVTKIDNHTRLCVLHNQEIKFFSNLTKNLINNWEIQANSRSEQNIGP